MITSIWTAPGGDASVARALREQVFCQELGMDQEMAWDSMDQYAFHLVLLLDDKPVAAGRMSYGGGSTAMLSRICVAKDYRRQGIGDGLIKIMDFKASGMGMQYSAAEVPEQHRNLFARIGYQEDGPAFSKYGWTVTPMKKETNDGTKSNCAH